MTQQIDGQLVALQGSSGAKGPSGGGGGEAGRGAGLHSLLGLLSSVSGKQAWGPKAKKSC